MAVCKDLERMRLQEVKLWDPGKLAVKWTRRHYVVQNRQKLRLNYGKGMHF